MRITALLGALLAASFAHAPFVAPAVEFKPAPRKRRYESVKHIRTGEKYPHSSTRQRARYARQIAAGQLNVARLA